MSFGVRFFIVLSRLVAMCVCVCVCMFRGVYVCLVVCFMLLLVVCCHLANKDIYIMRSKRVGAYALNES